MSEHKCRFILGSCVCGAMQFKRRFISKSDLVKEMTNRETTPPITPTPTDLDTIDDAIFSIEDYIGGNVEGVEKIDRMGLTVFLRTTLTQAIQAEIVKAEARGRTEVVSAVKDWADDTEVTYSRLIETELEKITALKEGLKG